MINFEFPVYATNLDDLERIALQQVGLLVGTRGYEYSISVAPHTITAAGDIVLWRGNVQGRTR